LNRSPERYTRAAVPHVMVRGAACAIDFYRNAFDATELFRLTQPNGDVLHAELGIDQSLFMLGDAAAPFSDPLSAGGTSVGLHVYVADVDALFQRAVDAGATPLQPPQDMFYGDRSAMLRDPFGHVWVFLTHQEDVTPDEIVQRASTVLGT
jgi:PhnB protein